MSHSPNHHHNEYVFSITKAEVQEIVAGTIGRTLDLNEMAQFTKRFEKHVGWEYIHEAIEDCIHDILQ